MYFYCQTDSIPELVARMGKLSLDSSVRECMAVKKEWKSLSFSFELVAQAEGDKAPMETCAAVYSAASKQIGALLDKVTSRPEYLNYLEIMKQLRIFGVCRRPHADVVSLPEEELIPA